ncbi:peptidyl-prolyl cis-trans isomerase [Candidatus Dependentiae bacterium]|nr:MAG: peptidyl-prolyl cis-trans isomerase [Candidatus Dependentiae bacterium]
MKNSVVLLIILTILLGVAGYMYHKKGMPLGYDSKQNSAIDAGTATKNLTGKPLVTMDGKVIITVDSLETEKQKIFKANPQIEKISAYMNINQSLLYGLTNYAVIDKYIEESGIKNTDNYKTDLQDSYNDVVRMINTKYFSQKYPSTVTESDVKKFYEENKDLSANFIIAKGGIKAIEVSFDQEAKANEFAQKVRAKNGNVTTVAQENGIEESKIKDLGLVHDQSIAIDAAVKKAILQITQFPTVVVVKTTDNKFSVVVTNGKEETKYRPYEQVKAQLKEYLEKEKQGKAIDDAINELKKTYNVVIDESFFGPVKEENSADLGDLSDMEMEDELESADNALSA